MVPPKAVRHLFAPVATAASRTVCRYVRNIRTRAYNILYRLGFLAYGRGFKVFSRTTTVLERRLWRQVSRS